MLDLNKMSPSDAKHSLEVLAWLNTHQDELKRVAAKNDTALSMAGIVAAGGFNADELSVSSTRFIPMTIHVFTDDISLADVPDALVALKIGEEVVFPTHEDNVDADPQAIGRIYGIDPADCAWTSNDPYAKI